MPRIFDNIDQPLLDALRETLEVSNRADFCVGYFNLRGWKQLDATINQWAGGEGQCCRLLVGMHRPPQEDLQALFRLDKTADGIDNATAIRLKKQLVDDFRNQLTLGAPTNEDEAGLRRLAAQIKARKVIVKLFLAYPLHAKLYLLFRLDKVNPATAFVGSSNLTLAGLSHQGELNVDVLLLEREDPGMEFIRDGDLRHGWSFQSSPLNALSRIAGSRASSSMAVSACRTRRASTRVCRAFRCATTRRCSSSGRIGIGVSSN
jgi:hypothetical protein